MISEKFLTILNRGELQKPLRKAGIARVDAGGTQDLEMALLVSEEETCHGTFLGVLNSVLIRRRTDLESVGELESVGGLETLGEQKKVGDDLQRWFGRIPQNDPLVWWLKMAVERYPMRLVVACDWRDGETSFHPSEDRFWFEVRDGNTILDVERFRNGIDRGWSTPDPRPWNGPYWRRFFGKRICWLGSSELTSVVSHLLGECPTRFLETYFPGFSEDGLVRPLDIFPLWLRLRWVEHLARRVRGLDCSYTSLGKTWPAYRAVRIVVDLGGADNSSYRPGTLPPSALASEVLPHRGAGKVGNLSTEHSGLIHLTKLSHCEAKSANQMPSAEVCWKEQSQPTAYCIMQMHKEVCSARERGKWEFPRLNAVYSALGVKRSIEAPGVIFGGALSGALPSHNTLSDLGCNSRSRRSVWRFLEIMEHALLRVAVCDERIQAWWDRDERSATNAIQRRVFSMFLDKPGTWKQGRKPSHGYYGLLAKTGERWKLELHEKEAATFFSTLFADDPWPAAAETLVIHQGILEKWEESKPLVALELAALKDDIPWVVVTSGRGKPDRLPPGVRFLPTSGIQNCLAGDRFDKLLLIRQIVACGEV